MKNKAGTLNSYQIVEILRNQHTKDVFVPECKDGSTQFHGHARMDVWVMNRSWVRLCFTGYEIKTSHADFKQDNKWHSYLPLCNQLYFVCPRGMIDPSEMPDGIGLKHCTEKRATTVKKAAHRDVKPPMELFCYLLMCRSKVVPPNYYEPETREQKIGRFKKWAEEKVETRRLGDILSYSIANSIDYIKTQNISLLSQVERWKKIQRLATAAGINNWDNDDRMTDKLAQFKKLIPDEYVDRIRRIESESRELISILENHRDTQPPTMKGDK